MSITLCIVDAYISISTFVGHQFGALIWDFVCTGLSPVCFVLGVFGIVWGSGPLRASKYLKVKYQRQSQPGGLRRADATVPREILEDCHALTGSLGPWAIFSCSCRIQVTWMGYQLPCTLRGGNATADYGGVPPVGWKVCYAETIGETTLRRVDDIAKWTGKTLASLYFRGDIPRYTCGRMPTKHGAKIEGPRNRPNYNFQGLQKITILVRGSLSGLAEVSTSLDATSNASQSSRGYNGRCDALAYKTKRFRLSHLWKGTEKPPCACTIYGSSDVDARVIPDFICTKPNPTIEHGHLKRLSMAVDRKSKSSTF
ncbi:hypothetical protein BDZ97DRAFT_1752774 [Flammula alnicola]|nr:hypothetical protein BDZ97DRAFT_1752774 [Flammula alnicola]